MQLGTQKKKGITAQLLLLIFPEKTRASHLKPKNLRFEFLSHNPPQESSINTFVLIYYQTPYMYVVFFECI